MTRCRSPVASTANACRESASVTMTPAACANAHAATATTATTSAWSQPVSGRALRLTLMHSVRPATCSALGRPHRLPSFPDPPQPPHHHRHLSLHVRPHAQIIAEPNDEQPPPERVARVGAAAVRPDWVRRAARRRCWRRRSRRQRRSLRCTRSPMRSSPGWRWSWGGLPRCSPRRRGPMRGPR